MVGWGVWVWRRRTSLLLRLRCLGERKQSVQGNDFPKVFIIQTRGSRHLSGRFFDDYLRWGKDPPCPIDLSATQDTSELSFTSFTKERTLSETPYCQTKVCICSTDSVIIIDHILLTHGSRTLGVEGVISLRGVNTESTVYKEWN